MDAEARIPEPLRHPAREVVLAVVELVRRERERMDSPALDDVDRDEAVVEEPRVEELHGEFLLGIEPQRPVRLEADVAPLIVAHLEEPLGHVVGIVEGLFREVLGPGRDLLEIERGARGPNRRP